MKLRPLLILAVTAISLFHPKLASAGSATWQVNPANSDWNTPTNWTPATVPNGPSDTALFATSNMMAVSLSAPVAVSMITFDSAASDYAISTRASTLTLSGVGIVNASSASQDFVADGGGEIHFTENATAGTNVSLSNSGALTSGAPGGNTTFDNNSTAGFATITNDGGPQNGFTGNGSTNFFGSATAGQANVTNNSGTASYGGGGMTTFADTSSAGDALFANKTGNSVYSGMVTFADEATAGNAGFTNDGGSSSSFTYAMVTFGDHTSAGHATFQNRGGTTELGFPGYLEFYSSSSAGHAIVTNEGSLGSNALGGTVSFDDASSAGDSTIILNGGLVLAGAGGEVVFNYTSTAANSTLVANDAGDPQAGGGRIFFFDDSTGGTAQVELAGRGMLDLSFHNPPGVTIGSLAGDGTVLLGDNNLTIGGRLARMTFSGFIRGTGTLALDGASTLFLDSANTYTGGTVINAGAIIADNQRGSATGRGPVQVNEGTLGGKGVIAGAVTIGSGTGTHSYLEPDVPTSRATLTLQSTLTFNADGSYRYRVSTRKATAARVTANGTTIRAGAQFIVVPFADQKLPLGTTFTAINNTAATPIDGAYANLPDGSTITVGQNNYQANYEGGDGNDLTLTVVP